MQRSARRELRSCKRSWQRVRVAAQLLAAVYLLLMVSSKNSVSTDNYFPMLLLRLIEVLLGYAIHHYFCRCCCCCCCCCCMFYCCYGCSNSGLHRAHVQKQDFSNWLSCQSMRACAVLVGFSPLCTPLGPLYFWKAFMYYCCYCVGESGAAAKREG